MSVEFFIGKQLCNFHYKYSKPGFYHLCSDSRLSDWIQDFSPSPSPASGPYYSFSLSLQWAMSKFKLPSHKYTRGLDNQYKLRERSKVWAQKCLNEILPISLGILMILFNFPSWFWLLGMLVRATKNRKDLPGTVKELSFYCIEIGSNQAADGEILIILLFWVTECHILLGIDFWASVKEWLDLQLESFCCATWVMQGLWWTARETGYRASLGFLRFWYYVQFS